MEKNVIDLKAEAYDIIHVMEQHQAEIERLRVALRNKNQEIAMAERKPNEG